MPNEWPNKETSDWKISPDFTRQDIKLSFRIEKKAADYLPEITQEDFDRKKERFVILLGEFEIDGNNVLIKIRGIFENDKDEERYYKEGKEEIYNINYPSIVKDVEYVKKNFPEYRSYHLIGEMHTHPVAPQEVAPNNPCNLSLGDIEGIESLYERGIISNDKPFIFGVAGLDESGHTNYAFYRMVKKENHFAVESVEHSK